MKKEIILNNNNNIEGSFLSDLSRNSIFDKGKYNELVYTICKLSSEVDTEERKTYSPLVWEICFNILKVFVCDLNPSDLVKIKELTDDEKLKVRNDLYVLGNFFSWNKNLDFTDYLI